MPDFADRRSKIAADPRPVSPSKPASPISVPRLADGSAPVPQTGMREALSGIDRRLTRGFKDLENRLQPPAPNAPVTPPMGLSALPKAAATREMAPVAPPASPDFRQRPAPAAQREATQQNTHNIRNISNITTGAATPRAAAGQMKAPMATVADQRAYYQYASARAPKHEADATRLAKVNEADELIKEGKLAPNKQIRQWAADIRSGNQRKVADINPSAVTGTLESAAGGREAAKALNTSKVAQIEEAHQAGAQSLQTRLAEKRKTAERSSSEEARRETQPQLRSIESTQTQSTSAPQSRSVQDHEMNFMMRHNDLAHENMAVASLETSTGGSENRAMEMKTDNRPKIGQMSSPSAALKPGANAMEQKKAPWAEGRELRQMADMLGTLITEVRRSYS